MVSEGGEWKMGLVIPYIGIVGYDLEGEAAPTTLTAVKCGVLGLEGLLVCDLEVSAANWLTVLCLANSLLKTAGLFSKPFSKMLILVPREALEYPHHIKIT